MKLPHLKNKNIALPYLGTSGQWSDLEGCALKRSAAARSGDVRSHVLSAQRARGEVRTVGAEIAQKPLLLLVLHGIRRNVYLQISDFGNRTRAARFVQK